MQKCTNCHQNFSLRGLRAHEKACFSDGPALLPRSIKVSQWKWAFDTWLQFEITIFNFFLPEMTISGIVVGFFTLPIWAYLTYYRYYYVITIVVSFVGLVFDAATAFSKLMNGETLQGGNLGYIASVYKEKLVVAKNLTAPPQEEKPVSPAKPDWTVQFAVDTLSGWFDLLIKPGMEPGTQAKTG